MAKRTIPAHVKRAVWERDRGQCTFVGEAGHRCHARKFLEFDHVDPVARGGQATVERPAVREVHQILSDHIPSQGPATIVHGDYRLDNCLVDDQGAIAAVLDWEICTLGDPLADVGLLMVYWADADDDDPALATSPTVLDGFPERAELLARYAERSGRDVSGIDFYVAFGYWKLACIVEGVYARYRGGAMGDADDDAVDAFGDQVDRLSAAAENAAAPLQ